MATAAAQAARTRTGPDPLTAQRVGAALRSGNRAEAEQILRRRLLEAPDDADALVTLADIAAGSGGLDEACTLLARALAVVPEAHPLRLRLAALHQQQSHFPIALTLLQQVPGELRRSFDLRAQEAALLGQLGRREEEIALYHELVREQPRNAPLWMTLGNALNYAGRRDEAVRALRKAIKLQPSFGEPWWSLANLKRFRFDDRDVAAMETALRRDLGPADALHFHFALGRAFEDRSRHEQSFAHYAAGNRLRAATLSPAQMNVTPFVEAAIATFTPPLFAHYEGAGCEQEGPIFVVGLQRSGSTLVEQILASHPEIEGTAELLTMQHLWDELARLGALHGRNAFEQILHSEPSLFREIGEQYLARTQSYRREGKRFFVDKLPANWMNVGLIRLALPNARIIDARRHPLACGFSNFKQHYASGVSFAYSLESIGRFYRDYLRLMQHFDRVQPGAVLHVVNERLIDDPEREVRRMLGHVGLAFDPACLDFHANKRAVHTPSAEQVRRPINRDGVDAWRSYDPWLGALKEALGEALERWQD
jgi:tetratricopeptide (TPR) repeat protein